MMKTRHVIYWVSFQMPLGQGQALAQWARDLSPWGEVRMDSDITHSLNCAVK